VEFAQLEAELQLAPQVPRLWVGKIENRFSIGMSCLGDKS